MKDWKWIGKYIVVIAAALLLGAAIGEMPLFKQATLGTPKLTAAGLVTFMGFAGALSFVWLLGNRAALQLQGSGGKASFLGFILLPLATLIIVSGAYSVLLVILKAFLSPAIQDIYNWLFILGITASAIWLVVVLYQHADSLMELFSKKQPE
jgi:hypothetical protein